MKIKFSEVEVGQKFVFVHQLYTKMHDECLDGHKINAYALEGVNGKEICKALYFSSDEFVDLHPVEFIKLAFGDKFIYDESEYMKTNNIGNINTVIKDGRLCTFKPTDRVFKIKD